ncbi:MAG: hypothetical protein HY918_02165 [Candidatus Doudnabacteria bacterium]|nr:hypothetical protein [Candidatus Doudnabacteria bacterium]
MQVRFLLEAPEILYKDAAGGAFPIIRERSPTFAKATAGKLVRFPACRQAGSRSHHAGPNTTKTQMKKKIITFIVCYLLIGISGFFSARLGSLPFPENIITLLYYTFFWPIIFLIYFISLLL